MRCQTSIRFKSNETICYYINKGSMHLPTGYAESLVVTKVFAVLEVAKGGSSFLVSPEHQPDQYIASHQCLTSQITNAPT